MMEKKTTKCFFSSPKKEPHSAEVCTTIIEVAGFKTTQVLGSKKITAFLMKYEAQFFQKVKSIIKL